MSKVKNSRLKLIQLDLQEAIARKINKIALNDGGYLTRLLPVIAAG